jgi:hypothetical protein
VRRQRECPAKTVSESWNRGKARWQGLTYYQRFETAVEFVRTLVIALIVLAVSARVVFVTRYPHPHLVKW